MKTRVLSFLCLVTAFACKDSPPGPPPSPNGSDTTSHSISWQTDSIGYYQSRLLDVWGTTPTSVYAAGLVEAEGTGLPTFLIRYNGSSWTRIADDSLSWWIGAGLLTSVHGLSDTALFIVGSSFDSYTARGFVGKWNGRRWVNISPDSSPALLSVWARSGTDAYACGARGTILHYDGTGWRTLQSGTTLDVWQIIGLPSGEVYAVASDYFNSFAGSVILRIEGNTVIQDQSFPVGQKFGVWGTADGEGYATGEGMFHKVNGLAWEEIATPNPRVVLWAVSGTASNNVIIGGAFGAVIHWSGRSWKFYDELYDRSSFKSYFKAFAIGNTYFLVGNTPSHALITIGIRNNP